MGVDVIAMVENSRQISLEDFLTGMTTDEWGKIYSSVSYTGEASWIEFEWESKIYFSLRFNAPRYHSLFEKQYDFDDGKYYKNPDFSYFVQVSFLKAMRMAERLAGGPVYLGNDVIWHIRPPEDSEERSFTIPFELDSMIDNWREIADIEITADELFGSEDESE